MAATATPPEAERRYRFTVDQYHRMADAGVVPEGVELLEGIVTVKGHHRNGHPVPFRFDTEEYRRLIEIGVLTEDDRVELIRGEVVAKMPHGDPHGLAIERINRRLLRLLPDDVSARCQLPIVLPAQDSTPEPDFVICQPAEVRGNVHPRPEHIFVVVEVADSSLAWDRTDKATVYAAAGIPVYWIVNLEDRQVEVYADPVSPPGADPHYRTRAVYRPGDAVSLTVGGAAVGPVPVADLLP